MIISHSRRFIFIKTVKTAGTSLEMALSKYCGEGDVLAPLEAAEEAERRALAGIGGQGHLRPVRRMRPAEMARYLLRGRRAHVFAEHSSAPHVRRMVGKEVWNGYFKFAVVRHPFDRSLSRFYYTRHYEEEHGRAGQWDHDSFDQFLRYRTELVNENWQMLTERDELLVDFVVHYERLEEDLREVSVRIGLPRNLFDDMREIGAKQGIRPRDATVRATLTDKQRDLIALMCEKEMSVFGYGADAPLPEPQAAAGGPRVELARSLGVGNG